MAEVKGAKVLIDIGIERYPTEDYRHFTEVLETWVQEQERYLNDYLKEHGLEAQIRSQVADYEGQ